VTGVRAALRPQSTTRRAPGAVHLQPQHQPLPRGWKYRTITARLGLWSVCVRLAGCWAHRQAVAAVRRHTSHAPNNYCKRIAGVQKTSLSML
jgi:hypothetical protein